MPKLTKKKVDGLYEIRNGKELLSRVKVEPTDKELTDGGKFIEQRDARRKKIIAQQKAKIPKKNAVKARA